MTAKAHPEDDAPNAKFLHQVNSPTAASLGNPLFPSSGVMTYRVTVVAGGFQRQIDVDAATGDDAAAEALKGAIGGRVAHVEPAPQKQVA